MQPISRRLKFYREKAHLSPGALSALTGIDVSVILDLEKGRLEPDIEVVKLFAHACDVSVDELLVFQASPKIKPLCKDDIESLEDDRIYFEGHFDIPNI